MLKTPFRKVSKFHGTIVDQLDKRLPSFVPRDRVTRTLLGTAAGVYVADIWSPFPVGESIAALLISIAILRASIKSTCLTIKTYL